MSTSVFRACLKCLKFRNFAQHVLSAKFSFFFKILSLGWCVRWYEVFIFYIVKSTRWRSQWPVENCLAITKVDKVERGLCESKTAFPSLSSHPVYGLMCGKSIWSLLLQHRDADSKQACL